MVTSEASEEQTCKEQQVSIRAHEWNQSNRAEWILEPKKPKKMTRYMLAACSRFSGLMLDGQKRLRYNLGTSRLARGSYRRGHNDGR